MAENARQIKKYPNRRLYDTETSTYITLADVKALVLAGQPLLVSDAKTGEDLTHSILLQVILDEEASGAPLLSCEALAALVRNHGQQNQAALGKYLDVCVRSFNELHQRVAAHAHELYGDDADARAQELWSQFVGLKGPAMQNMMASFLEQNRVMFQQMQTQSRSLFDSTFAPGSTVGTLTAFTPDKN